MHHIDSFPISPLLLPTQTLIGPVSQTLADPFLATAFTLGTIYYPGLQNANPPCPSQCRSRIPWRGTSRFRNVLVSQSLLELHTPLSRATLVYCDNVSAIYLSNNRVQHQRTKHIELDIHFVRDKVAQGHVRVLQCLLDIRELTFFLKDYPRFYLMIFAPISTFGNLPFRLRGCISH
ncbi:hypothetical protein E3N88_33997 [Mikania micrantha]|uniref:Reverse transcriptase Ty1/copia-type domain-containing protein n=1 Tax=Mikania micrantha TaxID=192012 RepID=A0A5N6MDJ1_9ASTR|nr:hypothetical protein E3N88_33997 [Mikania micrantha]